MDYTPLIDSLGNYDEKRNQAWRDLSAAGENAIPALINGLHHHENETVRVNCVMILERVATETNIDDGLLQAMQNDPSGRVTGHCIKVIKDIERDDVITTGVDMLIRGNVPAADRLRKPPQSRKAVAELNRRLSNASSDKEREDALFGLMRLGAKDSFNQYLRWLSDSDATLRFEAATAMDKHKHGYDATQKKMAYNTLLRLVKSEADEKVKARMIQSIGYFKRDFDQSGYETLHELAQDNNETIAKAARRGLKSVGYDTVNVGVTCSVCGQSQPERKVEKCHICGKPVCEDHWVRDPMRYHAFCSKSHEQEFTKKQGINYWK